MDIWRRFCNGTVFCLSCTVWEKRQMGLLIAPKNYAQVFFSAICRFPQQPRDCFRLLRSFMVPLISLRSSNFAFQIKEFPGFLTVF